MKQNIKALLTVAMTLSVFGTAIAQKENVKGAERIANSSKPNFIEARQLAAAALENEETKNDVKTWYVAGFVEEQEFTRENQKLVENKEQPDRETMNKALLSMFDFYNTVCKMEEGAKPKYTKKVAKVFEANLPYFINALGYYMEQKNYKEALRAAEDFRSIKKMPMFANTPTAALDSNAMMLNFFAIVVAYQDGQKERAITYAQEAKDVPYRQNEVYQILTQTQLETGDTLGYISTMKEGLSLFPKESYYTLNLINLYSDLKKYDEARQFLSLAIENDTQNPQLYDVMGRLYENEGNPTEAHKWFLKSIEIDENFADGIYDVGRSLFNMAATATETVVNKETQAKSKELLKQALPYLEKAYTLKPEQAYYILANVHYNLGNNARYEEIMKQHGGE